MSRILGGVGQSLARLLDIDGGRVRLTELRDQEGVSAVYDLHPIAEGEAYQEQTRGFDTGAINQSVNDQQVIAALPIIARIQGFTVATDDASRIASVVIFADQIGPFGSGRDNPLWLWVNGDPTYTRPANLVVGDANLATVLNPPLTQQWWRNYLMVSNTGAQKTGISQVTINVLTTGFGAGTVRCTGHMSMLFALGVGLGTLEIPLPSTG